MGIYGSALATSFVYAMEAIVIIFLAKKSFDISL